jgi:hypothetical protein
MQLLGGPIYAMRLHPRDHAAAFSPKPPGPRRLADTGSRSSTP